MKPTKHTDAGQFDLLRARLDQAINMNHGLVRLAGRIDWSRIETACAEAFSDELGRPPLPTRLMAGLAILKNTYDVSDENLVDRWVENPYWQYFCGMEYFQHVAPFDRSSISRWRHRMGPDRLKILLQESLAVGVAAGAIRVQDLSSIIVDTTVQEKAVMFPTDAKLLHRSRVRLVKLAKKHGVELRQSYEKVGKIALIKQQRYRHAKQFKRAKRCLRTLMTQQGRVTRDIERKIADQPSLQETFGPELQLAKQLRSELRGHEKRRIYSLHAREVECIGKGKAHKPYEFGVKVSIATTIARQPGGQFILSALALPGNPYDGHTLAKVIDDLETVIGNKPSRIVADKGYRGGNAPAPYDKRVYITGQKRGVTRYIKRQLKRRAAVEPVIGHTKSDHRMGLNWLAGTAGDAINAIMAAVGYNFSRLLAWLGGKLRALLQFLLLLRDFNHCEHV